MRIYDSFEIEPRPSDAVIFLINDHDPYKEWEGAPKGYCPYRIDGDFELAYDTDVGVADNRERLIIWLKFLVEFLDKQGCVLNGEMTIEDEDQMTKEDLVICDNEVYSRSYVWVAQPEVLL